MSDKLQWVSFPGGIRGVMGWVIENGQGNKSSPNINTLGEGMNPIIPPPAMDK